MKYYHVTPKTNLESILKDGLKQGNVAKQLSAGIFLFQKKPNSNVSIPEAARLLAKQLKRQRPSEFSEQWCLLEVDTQSFDKKIDIDPFIQLNLKWFDIDWNQYSVNLDRISPEHIKLIEEFEVITTMYDNMEFWGYTLQNMADFTMIENIKLITEYFKNGQLELALNLDVDGSLKKLIKETTEQIKKMFPNDRALSQLTDIELFGKINELFKNDNNGEDIDILELLRNKTLPTPEKSKTNYKMIKEFVNRKDNGENWRSVHHGLQHWIRVELFGILMCRISEDADEDVVRWFAYLHDCKRTGDGHDKDHGKRSAKYVSEIRDSYLKDLDDEQIRKLKRACELHNNTQKTDDPTVNICFDADRLDLYRVGEIVDPSKLASEIGVCLSKYPFQKLIDTARHSVGNCCLIDNL